MIVAFFFPYDVNNMNAAVWFNHTKSKWWWQQTTSDSFCSGLNIHKTLALNLFPKPHTKWRKLSSVIFRYFPYSIRTSAIISSIYLDEQLVKRWVWFCSFSNICPLPPFDWMTFSSSQWERLLVNHFWAWKRSLISEYASRRLWL
jgi:hypothetical protein